MKFQLIFLFLTFCAFFKFTNAGGPSLSEHCQEVCALCSGITDPACDCSLVLAKCLPPPTEEISSFESSYESLSQEKSSSETSYE